MMLAHLLPCGIEVQIITCLVAALALAWNAIKGRTR